MPLREQPLLSACGSPIYDQCWPLSDFDMGVCTLGKTEDLHRPPGPWNCGIEVDKYPALLTEENKEYFMRCMNNNLLARSHLCQMSDYNRKKQKCEEKLRQLIDEMDTWYFALEEVCTLRTATAIEIRRLEADSLAAVEIAATAYEARWRKSRPRSRSQTSSRRTLAW